MIGIECLRLTLVKPHVAHLIVRPRLMRPLISPLVLLLLAFASSSDSISSFAGVSDSYWLFPGVCLAPGSSRIVCRNASATSRLCSCYGDTIRAGGIKGLRIKSLRDVEAELEALRSARDSLERSINK